MRAEVNVAVRRQNETDSQFFLFNSCDVEEITERESQYSVVEQQMHNLLLLLLPSLFTSFTYPSAHTVGFVLFT